MRKPLSIQHQYLLAAGLVILGAASQRAHARQAMVDEQVVAPNEQGMAYYISPRGGHLVAITQKGSRYVVLHDGVPGPLFDQILNNGSGSFVNFSPDGNHFGYVGRVDKDWVVVVDNKEALRRPIGTNYGIPRGNGGGVRFSPNGKHWFLFYTNGHPNGFVTDPDRFIWDGVAGPAGATGPSSIAVSPDGEHHAYNIANPTNPNQRALVIDGKAAQYLAFDPVYSPDGTHLYTTRTGAPVQGKPVTELLVDGRPIARAANFTLVAPPVGDQLVIVPNRFEQARGDVHFLVAGGKKVPDSDDMVPPKMWFSADAKHYAALIGQTTPQPYLIVDGIKQRAYDAIDSVKFTDTGKVVYTVRAGSRHFVVTGDQESEVPLTSYMFPIALGKGGRVGFIGSEQTGNVVVSDGKSTRTGRGIWPADLSFSPDGTRSAYFVGGAGGGPGGNVVVDNVPGPPSSTRDFGQIRKSPLHFIWSPDSRYTVSYGSPGAAFSSDMGWLIGDRYLSRGNTPNIMLPTFTPDSKHFFWIAGAGQRSMMEVWMNGKMIYEFDDQGREPLRDPGNWDMGADGVLTFIVQTVDGFKRIRVTPGPENGFEAWLATGKKR